MKSGRCCSYKRPAGKEAAIASICIAACSFAVYWLCVITATLSCRCRCSVTPSDMITTLGSRRSSGLVVSALDLKSSLALTTSWICSRYSSLWFNSLSVFVHSQLVCLLSVKVLNITCSVHLLYSVAICIQIHQLMTVNYQATYHLNYYYYYY